MLNAKIRSFLSLVLFVSLFSLATPVHASELTISSSTRLDGLTFVTPFYLPNDMTTGFLANLQFGTPSTLFLSSKPQVSNFSTSPIPTPPPIVEVTPEPTSITQQEDPGFRNLSDKLSVLTGVEKESTLAEQVFLTEAKASAPSPQQPPFSLEKNSYVFKPESFTPTPSSTPFPIHIALTIPTPSATPQPPASTPIPSPVAQGMPELSNGGLNADKLFDMVNTHRTNLNLPAFQKDERSCQLAVARAPEIDHEISAGIMHKGMYGRNLPYWNTENIITMNSEEAAFTWWIHDYIHKKQIEGDYKYSCLACSGNACAEEFTNFIPK